MNSHDNNNHKKREKKFEFNVNTMIGSTYSNLLSITSRQSYDKDFRIRYYNTKVLSAILSFLGATEKLIYRRKIRKFQIKESPIFIIGFWRSGTTLLHNVLTQNPEYGYVSLFQAIFPNQCFINQRWLKKIANIFLPETRPFDQVKLDFNLPQEEEIGMGNMQELSFYNFFYYPNSFDYFLTRGLLFDDATDKEIKKWKQYYKKLVKIALINTGRKRFISKNPPHTVRIKLLLEMFPGAKFIYMHRNTYESLFSFQRFMHAVHHGIKLQHYDQELQTLKFIRLYKVMLEQYQLQKGLIPPGQLIEIKFEEFEKDILGTVKNIYGTLNLPGFEQALPYMEKYVSHVTDYSRDKHILDPKFIQLIDHELGSLVEK